jgi:hypothetical protein
MPTGQYFILIFLSFFIVPVLCLVPIYITLSELSNNPRIRSQIEDDENRLNDLLKGTKAEKSYTNNNNHRGFFFWLGRILALVYWYIPIYLIIYFVVMGILQWIFKFSNFIGEILFVPVTIAVIYNKVNKE